MTFNGNPLDQLPERADSHDTAEAAEVAFRAAIGTSKLFVIQQSDRSDYGTDLQIEARSGGAMTNARAHVQLKGTTQSENADGSVSVSVARQNLNYLLVQPESIYACYHIPSGRLLCRRADDLYSEYEHRGAGWSQQQTITVRFHQAFDAPFQARLHARLISFSRTSRDWRLDWAVTPPEHSAALVDRLAVPVDVPFDPSLAQRMLSSLYEEGHDVAISKAFDRFESVLGSSPGAMDLAYMAEINLGINGAPSDTQRIRESIPVLRAAAERGQSHRGSLLYCEGNAHLSLGDFEAARDAYSAALSLMDAPELVDIAAQCTKNLGSALERMGKLDGARKCYERAIDLDPDLGEAHFALALWYCRFDDSPALALEYLDQVARRSGSALQVSSVQGWRINVLFRAGDIDGGFREINALISDAKQADWIWPWCARHVSQYAKATSGSAKKAIRFWRAYLREYPADAAAECERLLCHWLLHSEGTSTDIDFDAFKSSVVQLVARDGRDAAFLWDRVGHWAQDEGDWEEAELAYRTAYDMEPERYGYCLGTALNFLSRYADALPILVPQALQHMPDAMSWFQVAVAHNGLGNVRECIAAYEHVLEMDEGYELAWFNLGGAHWNSGDQARATEVWREAIGRFSLHELAGKLQRDLPELFAETP